MVLSSSVYNWNGHHKFVWYYYNCYWLLFGNFYSSWCRMKSFAADFCNEMFVMYIASHNILTSITSCNKHFCLPFNKATLLLILPFLVLPLSHMFCFFEGWGKLKLLLLSFLVTNESRRSLYRRLLCLTIWNI